MADSERFPFLASDDHPGEAGLIPQLPITLGFHDRSTTSRGLLDTGATVNVLPYQIGVELGVKWDEAARPIHLTGNLTNFEARPVVLSALVGSFGKVRLAFAWTRSEDVPLILGQVNFFMEFNVCFYRSLKYFDVYPKG
jgi:hypothetical protein